MCPSLWPSSATARARARRRGELKNSTAIDSLYKPTESSEIRIDTIVTAPEDASDPIVTRLRAMRMLSAV